ncbi:MAG: glycyl-radical enzyme activating protein [Clostridia bacterium]|nr:glycyl-radical enzyme activating protein [Clostridia bacterium]
MEVVKAKIFEIKRFAVHDGDGIRTTVFFKGCPLRCVWCHNPEGLLFATQTAFYEHKCIGCGECKRADFCVDDCRGGARVVYGKEMSVDELLPILLEDRDFYENSGGGVTLSGGECLMQADFCAELLKRLKESSIHTAVDTCGFAAKSELDKVLPYTDVFLFDLKAYDEDVHIRCTGVSNKRIIENLKYLDKLGKEVEIRIPFVPDYNDTQIEKIAELIAGLRNVSKIRLLAYHNYAGSKYEALGMQNTLPTRLPTDEEMQNAKELIKSITGLAVL